MPRQVVATIHACLFLLAGLTQAYASPLDLPPEPRWSLHVQQGEIQAGEPFSVTAEIILPPGWYQDSASDFLKLEPAPPARVVSGTSSEPALREGKKSFTGTFTLTRSIVVNAPGTQTVTFTAGWQICQIDGVCLLPAERKLTVNIDVSPASPGVGQTDAGLAFWGALLGAFLGGLLLNLMPCVFPVLALKAVGLASSAGQTFTTRRREALLFAAGGWSTITVLGLVTAVLAALGQRLDWGFTFQQPLFVWTLTLVFWVFALQLWGVWSWRGSPFALSLPGNASGTTRSLAGGAFLVLAAAPCTAPLLGPALGFAFAQPPVLVPLFFAAAGLGLVAPVLALALWPTWTKFIPKPGSWTVVFERTAGFFLAATVLYLVWIFTQQTRPATVWPALAVLSVLALVFAFAGRFSGHRFGGVLRWVAAAALVAGFAAALPWTASEAVARAEAAKSGWTPYSSSIIETSLKAGKPVLVDATAAWCATCQVNEAAVLDRADVTTLLDRLGVVRVRADYTLPDPAIRDWLASVQRAGLPVYALYRPGKPVVLFPELLTEGNFTRVLPDLVPVLK